MFTGIVSAPGSLASMKGARARFSCPAAFISELEVGGSVAVSGCCLTVVEVGEGWWEADVVAETLARTTLGSLRPGEAVNLELPVTASSMLGGHVVQGHVDGTGEVLVSAPGLRVAVGPALARYMVEKGAVALDGVSLTIVSIGGGALEVAVVPHTAAATTLGHKRAGDRVNVEVDVLAKYVERLLGPVTSAVGRSGNQPAGLFGAVAGALGTGG